MLNILSTEDSALLDGIRTISATFDRAIYYIISLIYDIILEIANIDLFDNGTVVEQFSGRIYTLIGIFMLFKLSFSIINYIINPDSVFDKEKGGSKLIKNIVISFVLIIIMPNVFTLMNDVQNAILNDHVIENFIFGVDKNITTYEFKMDESCPGDGRQLESEGDYIALTIFRPFFQIDPYGTDADDLKGGYYCLASKVSDLLVPEIYNSPNTKSLGFAVDGIYTVDYWFIISSLVGGVVAVVLISFAMDVAVRAIKIAFLQIISPIPIISYIDPNQSKNGMLIKWAKELGKTWADLFIKLIALYFVILIITMIDTNNILDGVNHKLWVSILIIIGGLMFAKKLPTLIGNMLGIKLDGGFNINPLKKLEKEALFGKGLANLPGKTLSAASGGLLSAAGAFEGHRRAKNKFNKDLSEQDKKYADFKAKQAEKLSHASSLAERQQIIHETLQHAVPLKREIDEKKSKIESEYNEKYSNKHPIAAGIMEAFRGTKLGFSKEVKKPKDIITNSIEAAKMSAKEKNQHDLFTIGRRFDDMVTDIAGVKNESGTTSVYKQELKQTNEQLKDIGNYISQLNHSIAGMMQKAPGGFTFEKNDKGEIEQRTIDGFNYQSALGMSRQDVDRIITELRNLRAEEKAGNKRVNELNEAMKMDKT